MRSGKVRINISKTFIKTLLYIVIAMVLMIIVLSDVLYINFETAGFKLIYQYNKKVLSQISYNLNYMNDTVKNFYVTGFMDPDIQLLMYGENIDPHYIQRNANKFSRVVAGVNMFHSASIYNNHSKQLFSSFGSSGEAIDIDEQTYHILVSKKEIPVFSPIPRILQQKDYYQDTKVFSYFMYDLLDNNGYPEGALVVNVKTDWLFDNLKKLNDKDNNFIIINTEGKIIADGSGKLKMFERLERDYIEKILLGKEEERIIAIIDNRKFVITYLPIPDTDWIFIDEQPYSKFFGHIAAIKNVTIIITLVFLGVASMVSTFIARNIYLPLGRLVKQVKHLSENSFNILNYKDDTEYLSKVFNISISRLEDYKQYKKTADVVLRENILKALLLESNFVSTQLFEDNIVSFKKIFNENSRYLLALFKIDNYNDFANIDSKSRRLTEAIVSDTLKEKMKRFCSNSEVVFMESGVYIVIINIGVFKNTNYISLLEEKVEETQQELGETTQITLSAFISDEFDSLNLFNIYYREIQNLSKYRLIYGKNCILFKKTIQGVEKDYNYPEDIENRFVEQMKIGSLHTILDEYRNFVKEVSKNNIDYFIPSLMRLALTTNLTIQQININRMKPIDIDFDSVYSDLLHAEMMENVDKIFFDLFNSINEQQKFDTENKYDVVVSSVKDYINLEYDNRDLSLKKLASEFKMSSSYLGKIFREAIGKSVGDYVNSIRLKKAIELLESTNYNISKVMDSVGYDNESHFYKLFKKTYGVTPKEFRISKALKEIVEE